MSAPNLSKTWSYLPGFVTIGDSTAHQGNVVATISSLTAVGTRATVVGDLSNFMNVGQRIIIKGADQSEYNGTFVIDEVVDATTSKFNLDTEPSVGTATGAAIFALFWHRINDKNWSVISNGMSGHKGLYLGNFAHSGSVTSSLSSQISNAFEPSHNHWGRTPDIVFISSGVNDARGAVAVGTTTANLEAAINTILDYGAYPVVLTNWPYSQSYGDWSISIVNKSRQINDWIRSNVPALGGIVIDANEICMDLTNQYGNWTSGYTTDGLHPSKTGAFQVAKAIKSQVWDLIKTPTDDRSITNISVNSTLTGTGGSTAGTGASGSVASNFTMIGAGGGAQTVVGAKGLPLTGSGESQRLTITAAAADDSGALRTGSFHVLASAGEKIFCRVRARTKSTMDEVKYINLTTNVTVGGVTTLKFANAIDTDSTTDRWGEEFDLTLETPPITVQASTTTLYFEFKVVFGAAGSAVIDIDHFDIYKYS